MSGPERALFIRGLAEPHLVAGAVDVLLLEGLRRHFDELGRTLEIGFGQVDKALLIAAVDAAALAGKSKGIQVLIVTCFLSTGGFGLTLAWS